MWEMALSCLKHMKSILFMFTLRPVAPVAYSRQCSQDSAWADVFVRSSRSYT